MGPLDLVQLTPLMNPTSGGPEISVGLIDGPVTLDLPHLAILRLFPWQHVTFKVALLMNRTWEALGRRGLMAPGVAITSLGTNGKPKQCLGS